MRLRKMRFVTAPPGRRSRFVSYGATALAVASIAVSSSGPAHAQAKPLANLPGPPSPGNVGEQVAAALYNRGMALFELGDIASAKTLFVESLERSAEGSRAADALGMLRKCNEKLGIENLEAGRPAAGGTNSGPIDPYAGGPGDEAAPLDPYAATAEAPIDPYAAPPSGEVGETTDPKAVDAAPGNARIDLMISGGLVGFLAGLAVVGPYNRQDDGGLGSASGAAVPVGLLASAGGIYLGSYLAKKYNRAAGKAVSYGAFWGMYSFAHLGNVFVGEDSDGNDIYRSMAVGSVAGAGLGHFYSKVFDPSEGDVAVLNSGALLGTAAGLMLGAAIDPPRGDAYSLNMGLGSMAGIGAGIYFRDKFKGVSVRRMTFVNAGAMAGAVAPWLLVYPAIVSDDGDEHQAVGFLSALTMAGGAYLTWIATENDEPTDAASDSDTAPTAPTTPALVQRQENGDWNLSSPLPRPMQNSQLAPSTGFTMGADILSGRF